MNVLWVKYGLMLVLAAGVFWMGTMFQKGREAERREVLVGQLSEAAVALGNANASLRASAAALRSQKAAALRAIEAERQARVAAEEARGVAEQALAESRAASADYARRLEQAARATPACDTLLKTDVRRVCGL